jgi:hypothetical protein
MLCAACPAVALETDASVLNRPFVNLAAPSL